MTSETNRAPAAPDLTDAASAAEYIEKLAADYLRDNASTEYDTGAVAFHYGEAGRDFHSALVELAEDLRSHVKPARAEAAPVPASTGRDPQTRKLGDLADLLPVEFMWGDALQPNMLVEILNKYDSHAPVAARALDADAERRAFEVAMNASRFFPAELDFTRTKSPSGRDEYENSHLQSNWEGWQARAMLAARATAESAPASAAPPKPPQAT